MPDLAFDTLLPTFDGAVAIVTGAGGRLGRLVTARLVEAGARVAALDRQPPEGTGAALALGVDLTDEAETVREFDKLTQRLGRPYALVHTAGMWDGRPLATTSLSDWRTVLDANLTSAFLVFREASRCMIEVGEGRLVAIASGQGADRGVGEQAAYSASKAGVVRLVEAVAAEHRGTDLTAAAVAPSTILFGGEAPGSTGVPAAAVAALCVALCGPLGAVHNGAVLRAYGTA